MKRNSTYSLNFRKLLADVKQYKEYRELALETSTQNSELGYMQFLKSRYRQKPSVIRERHQVLLRFRWSLL